MRVVVTGATGFLGQRLCHLLRDAGFDVVGLGRNRQIGAALEAGGMSFIPHDLVTGSVEDSGKRIGRADGFVHAAALSSAWGPRKNFLMANVDGTQNALELARGLRATRFVQISSPSVSFRYADQIAIRESDPLPKPVNAYAESKQIAEGHVLEAGDLAPVILRPRAIYGRGDVALLPRLLRAVATGPLPLMRGGRALAHLTHVDDVCGAILSALKAPQAASGRIYNIAGPDAVPIRDLVEAAAASAGIAVRWQSLPWPMARALGHVAEARAWLTPGQPEPRVTLYGLGLLAFSQVLDTSAAARDLGFTPRIAFAEGLARSLGGEGGG
nr:NAD(P)-dependent oxidoreductase [uncultured Gellertiella sp.]